MKVLSFPATISPLNSGPTSDGKSLTRAVKLIRYTVVKPRHSAFRMAIQSDAREYDQF
jgi:hypothetical protein